MLTENFSNLISFSDDPLLANYYFQGFSDTLESDGMEATANEAMALADALTAVNCAPRLLNPILWYSIVTYTNLLT